MKKLTLGVVIGICFTALIAAGVESYTVNKQTAEVNKRFGLFVFTDCNPVLEYEILGEVKSSSALALSDDYGSRRDALIKKAKKNYPNADGVLLYPETDGLSKTRADVIKFK